MVARKRRSVTRWGTRGRCQQCVFQFLLLWTGSTSLLLLPTLCSAFAGASQNAEPHNKANPIPITVLAGFLGSGKTTLLQNLLENDQGLRIAVVVNDVASVNIDSKLISSMNAGAAGIVELQNGCACCSKSEELLASVADLVTLQDLRNEEEGFDHIVIELSGVADPGAVRAKFQEAALYDMPLMDRVQLDTLVTLIDCSTFTDYLQSTKVASEEEAPELFYREGEETRENAYGEDIPSGLLETLGIGPAPQQEDSGVAELIVSQTETADVVLLNKIDLADDMVVAETSAIVRALNPRAHVVKTTFGRIPLPDILGVARGKGVALAGIVDDHKDAVHAVACDDPNCTDSSHSHTHDHKGEDPDCTDHIHGAQEHHQQKRTDASHSHSHTHSHSHSTTSNHGGIGSFVYRARRPFHPGRLLSFLHNLPIRRGIPMDGDVESSSILLNDTVKTALGRVLRSKGFTWFAESAQTALFWSQAGTSFDLSCLGSWWATLPRGQWPPEAVHTILQDFDKVEHTDEDGLCSLVGDRRQEIVFIGPTLGDAENQEAIRNALDQCLLNDAEWSFYGESRSDEAALRKAFPSSINAKMVTY